MSTETEQPGIGPWKRKKIRHPPPTISPYPTRKPKPDDSSSPSSALREWRSDQWPNGSWFSAQRPRVKCKCNSNSSDCPHPVFQFEECKKLSLVGQLLQKYQIKKENGKGIGFDKEQGQFIPWDLFKSHLQKTIQLSATTSPYPNGIKRFEFEKCIVWTDLPNPEALRVWLPLKSLQDSDVIHPFKQCHGPGEEALHNLVEIDSDTIFVLIWDKTNRKFRNYSR